MDGILHIILDEAKAKKHCNIYYCNGNYTIKLSGKKYTGTFDSIREQLQKDILARYLKDKYKHRVSVDDVSTWYGRTKLHVRCFFICTFNIKSILFHVRHLFR